MDETLGAVVISPQVVTTVVRQVAESTDGVARLSTSLSGRMSRVFRGSRSASGVDIQVEDGAVTIDVYVIALPNTQLLALGQALQREIHRAISDVVGMPVRAVNIHFADVQDPLDTTLQ
ncbi:MAG: Asp23/Gls24 family envelope stress response protein [Chloroflexota bacterium]|nr:MAG: Asp23/Gls24 family envelope stress response protein [Chloroflexota bacterium]